MNNLQMIDCYVNFKAALNEIKSIQRACFNLSQNNIKHGLIEHVDIAEIGTKAYITSITEGNHNLVKIEIKIIKALVLILLLKRVLPKKQKNFSTCQKVLTL